MDDRDQSVIERAIARSQERRRLTNVVIEAARLVCEAPEQPLRVVALTRAVADLDAHTGQSGASRAAD